MRTSTLSRERALADILSMTQAVLRSESVAASRRALLSHLQRIFDATGAVFVAPGLPAPLQPGDAEAIGSASDLPSLYGLYLHEDPGLPLLQRARLEPRARVLTSEVLLRGGELVRTSYYHEVMRPRAMHHAMAILLAAERRAHGVAVLYRAREQPPFAARDVAAASTAASVLSSALESVACIEHSLQVLRPSPAAAADAARPPHQSVAVLDQRLAVLYRDRSGPAGLTDWLDDGWHERTALRPLERRCRALLAGDADRAGEALFRPPGQARDAGCIAIELRRIRRDEHARLVLLLRPALRTAPVRTAPMRLSPRELEVAGLLAEGASHAAIAAHLALSVHTVARHAAAVYGKLRVPGRGALAARLIARAGPHPQACPALTGRERQIAAALLEGSSNKEIAARFALSIATVSNHLQKIYRKAGVHDRIALIRRLGA